MTHKLGVLVLHGIGSQESDFADGFASEVARRLGARAAQVRWKPVWWAPVLQERERRLLHDLSQNDKLDWMWLRKFVVDFLADAVAYQRVPGERLKTYERIHDCVAREMHALRSELRAGSPQDAPEPPLCVIAHSLGAHIISNYLWDLQHPESTGPTWSRADNGFERGETLAGIVTFGCNIPLFTLAYDELLPITFPSPALAASFPIDTPPHKLAARARWLNLYDPDDVLGYPLKPLSPQYAATVHEDVALNAGGLLTSWNPTSHNAYWTDNGVTRRAADLIAGLLELL